jgi:HEPN domain-containing protein
MTVEEHFNFWIESATHDLSVAQSLFDNHKFDWCLFLGHLVIEKTLKAIYVKKNDNKNPPKIHNLNRLAELIGINLSVEQKILYDRVTDFNIEARYPQYKNEFYKTCTYDFTHQYLNKIKGEFEWLKSLQM